VGKVFKIHSINSDGTEADEKLIQHVICDEDGKPYLDKDGQPEIFVMLRPISQSQWRDYEREFTKRIFSKKSRAMEEQTDWIKVYDAAICYAIQSWKGIVGADDLPLDYTSSDAKIGLPGDLKSEIVKRALQGEAVNAESFRTAS
jgi:hypothetical protein